VLSTGTKSCSRVPRSAVGPLPDIYLHAAAERRQASVAELRGELAAQNGLAIDR